MDSADTNTRFRTKKSLLVQFPALVVLDGAGVEAPEWDLKLPEEAEKLSRLVL